MLLARAVRGLERGLVLTSAQFVSRVVTYLFSSTPLIINFLLPAFSPRLAVRRRRSPGPRGRQREWHVQGQFLAHRMIHALQQKHPVGSARAARPPRQQKKTMPTRSRARSTWKIISCACASFALLPCASFLPARFHVFVSRALPGDLFLPALESVANCRHQRSC